MRGVANALTIGERVAWYRRRRGMSQEVFAGLVGHHAGGVADVALAPLVGADGVTELGGVGAALLAEIAQDLDRVWVE